MLELGLATVPKVAIRYRHMMAEDTAIWRQFIFNGDYIPEVVWYDVHIGTPVEVGDEQPTWMARMADRLTRKRIDVVGRVGNDYFIIELKPRASYDAFGQVVFYANQFEREFTRFGKVVPVIITDLVDPDIMPVCDEAGVLVLEVGEKEKG